MLPKISHPEFEKPLSSNPKKMVRFRPFVSREHKNLLIALEGGEANDIKRTVINILRDCITSDIKVEELPLFDLEYLFLQLRSKSIGETIDVRLRHKDFEKCDHITLHSVDLESISVQHEEGHSNIIMFEDGLGMTMNYPSIEVFDSIEESFKTETGIENLFSLIAQCVQNVFDKDTVYEDFSLGEIQDFIGNLSKKNFEKIVHFFKTMPKLKHTIEYKCEKCGEIEKIDVEGLQNFFL